MDKIDFVVTWVDMDDPVWRALFSRYKEGGAASGGGVGGEATVGDTVTGGTGGTKVTGEKAIESNSVSAARFRRYWFRGVEKFAPWVGRIHFVTCGQKPEWLDESNPRLHLVDHKDFIPEEFLPLFNSASIEMWMHRIPGLSERFVYFNDDFFLTAPTPPERFFQGGLPCDIAVFRYNSRVGQWSRRIANNVRLINRHFDKFDVQRRFHDKWFTSEYGGKAWLTKLLRWWPRFVALRVPHNAQAYLRRTFEDLWAHCEAELLETSTHRFRSVGDLTPELIRTWQVCRGDFVPYDTYKDTKMFPLVIRPREAIRAVREQKYRLVCLNDNVHIRNYERVMRELGDSFAAILPDKCSFEL